MSTPHPLPASATAGYQNGHGQATPQAALTPEVAKQRAALVRQLGLVDKNLEIIHAFRAARDPSFVLEPEPLAPAIAIAAASSASKPKPDPKPVPAPSTAPVAAPATPVSSALQAPASPASASASGPCSPSPSLNSQSGGKKVMVSGIEAAPELVDTPRQKRQKRPKMRFSDELDQPEPPFYAACRGLVKAIRQRKESLPFHEPVDTSVVTDYLDVVKRPMDLSTVSHKLSNRGYASSAEFEADMRLIFSNCLLYNRRDTPYAQWALVLEDLFATEFAKLRVRGKLVDKAPPRGPRTPKAKKGDLAAGDAHGHGQGSKKTGKGKKSQGRAGGAGGGAGGAAGGGGAGAGGGVQSEVERLQQHLKKLESQLRGIQGQHLEQTLVDVANPKGNKTKKKPAKRKRESYGSSTVLPPGLKVHQSDSESDDDAPMTYEEKCELSENINKLAQSPKLARVVQIIRERMPELNAGADDDEIEIDIDALDNGTLRHLDSYVKSCLAPSSRQPPQKRAKKGKAQQAHPQPRAQLVPSAQPIPQPIAHAELQAVAAGANHDNMDEGLASDSESSESSGMDPGSSLLPGAAISLQ